MTPEKAAAASIRPNRARAAPMSAGADPGFEGSDAGDRLDGGPGGLELGDEVLGRIAHHEVVAPGGQRPAEGRSHVEATVANDGNPSGVLGHRRSPSGSRGGPGPSAEHRAGTPTLLGRRARRTSSSWAVRPYSGADRMARMAR